MNYQNKNIVVTGGTGFIGRNLVDALLELGANVSIIDLPDANYSMISERVNVIRGSVLDQSFLDHALLGSDYVFHLAAKTDLSGSTIEDYKVNFEGTRNIIEAIHENSKKCKLIFFSTQLVVGIFNETRFIKNTEPYRTKTLYGESKILAEKIVQDKCRDYQIPYIIFRPTSVYGPYGREPYRDFFLTIKKKQYFHIGKADNLISMVYVKNLIEQCLYITNSKTEEKIFFGNELYPYTMREFSNSVANYFGIIIPTLPYSLVYICAYLLGILKIIGINVPLYPFRLKNITSNYCYDIGNSLMLGFYPKYSLEEGISETLNWYMDNDQEYI